MSAALSEIRVIEQIAHALFARRRKFDQAWDDLDLDVILQYRADARAAFDVLRRVDIADLGQRVAAGIDAERRKYDDPAKERDLYNRGILYGLSVASRIASEAS